MTSKKVIIVDHSKADCFIHKILLRNVGITDLVIFDYADDALDYLQTHDHQADFIFLDPFLPIEDGYSLIDKLGALGLRNKKTEIIIFSASLDPKTKKMQNKDKLNL